MSGTIAGDRPLSVVLNPAASGGRGSRMRAAVEHELRRRGIRFTLTSTRGPGHARELARESSRLGTEMLLVVGGDGTIHEVANGILEEGVDPPALAVVPVGTGNDFYRIVGAPRRFDSAIELVTEGEVAWVDVGAVPYQGRVFHFVNLIGVGLDVDVLRRRWSFSRLSGLPQYLAALVATLCSFRPTSLRVELGEDGEYFSGPALVAGLTVGPSLGGGFMISPEASPEDGLLDFFLVEPLGAVKIARYIPKVLRGTHVGLPEFHLRRVPGARISRSDGEPFFFELDGELMANPVTELEILVRVQALPVVVPRGRGGRR